MTYTIIYWFNKFNIILVYLVGVFSTIAVKWIFWEYQTLWIVWIILSALMWYYLYQNRNILDKFEFQIKYWKWNKEFIDNKEIWICDYNKWLQIEKVDKSHPFSEEWTRRYSDENGSSKDVLHLKQNNVVFKELIWISIDGGRIDVPLPKRKEWKLYYEKNSIEFQISKIVSHFDEYSNIEWVCEQSGIIIK